MITFNYWRGALLAISCAGPVFILPLMFTSTPSDENGVHFGALVFALLLSTPFGAAFAFLPVVFGGYFMALWGSRSPQARNPLVWAAAGALLAAGIALVLTLLAQADDFSLSGWFAFTGAVCALIVRFGTSWDDETPPTPMTTHEGEVK